MSQPVKRIQFGGPRQEDPAEAPQPRGAGLPTLGVPPRATVAADPATMPAPTSPAPAAAAKTTSRPSRPARTPAVRKATRPAAGEPRRAAIAGTGVYLPAPVRERLRRYAAGLAQSGQKRTFSDITLDAVDRHADELAKLLEPTPVAKRPAESRFTGRPSRRARSTGSDLVQVIMRWSAGDLTVIDQLVAEVREVNDTVSRSALIAAALGKYLPE